MTRLGVVDGGRVEYMVMDRNEVSPMRATAPLATIRDRSDREVARVEAQQQGEELAIRILFEDESWRDKLAEVEQGKLRLMIDGAVYLQRTTLEDKEFLPLNELVANLTSRELRLEYDPNGVESGHNLKRRIAQLRNHYVPFTDLLDILRESAHAG
jgi:hypothetical protein